jgi:hypothetical protein
MADTTVQPPFQGTGTTTPPIVVDQDAAGNYVPVSKIVTGALGTNAGPVVPGNPLVVGGQDGYGNAQNPVLRQTSGGLYVYEVRDTYSLSVAERVADAVEALRANDDVRPVGDLTSPVGVQLVIMPGGPTAIGGRLPPPSVGYAQAWQALTCTIAGLTSTSQRQSTAVYSGAMGIVDALVMIEFKTAAAATSATGIVNVYAYGSFDGSNFGDTVTGTDAAVTLTSPPNVTIIGSVNAVANSTTYKSNPFSVAAAFGGSIPPYWGIVVENKTSATLLAAGPTYARWLGVY